MAYQKVYSMEELGLGGTVGDLWDKFTGAAKTGSDIYQLQKQQKEAAAMRAATPAEIEESQSEQKGFLEKHGMKLAIGAGAVVLLLVILKMKK